MRLSCFIKCSLHWNSFTSEEQQENSVKNPIFLESVCGPVQTGAGSACSEFTGTHQF